MCSHARHFFFLLVTVLVFTRSGASAGARKKLVDLPEFGEGAGGKAM